MQNLENSEQKSIHSSSDNFNPRPIVHNFLSLTESNRMSSDRAVESSADKSMQLLKTDRTY